MYSAAAVFSFLRHLVRPRPAAVAYRLRAWPDLPLDLCTPPVLRTLCQVGGTPFSVRWFAARTSVPERTLEELLEQLARRGEVERLTDPERAARLALRQL